MLELLQEVHLVLSFGTLHVLHSSWQLSQILKLVFNASLVLTQDDKHNFVPFKYITPTLLLLQLRLLVIQLPAPVVSFKMFRNNSVGQVRQALSSFA